MLSGGAVSYNIQRRSRLRDEADRFRIENINIRKQAMRPIHFEILADKPEEISRFYQEVLGWKIETWPGPVKYWLVTTGPKDKPGIDGGIMHREFPQAVINTVAVDSIDQVLAKVQAAGGRVVQGPGEIPGIGTHAYCADPEGNLFGVLQPTSM
jgi:predicted enzyme related to lactoylglutathione lyase